MRQEFRQLQVERSGEKDALTFAASVSSEYPVERIWGVEVLSHASTAVDLSRAVDGLPLLVSHDMRQPVGMAERVRLQGGRLHADLRFFSTDKGREYATMVGEGLRGVSIGYSIDDMQQDGERAGVPIFRVTRFTPYEISIAPVAADPTVGVGRSRQTLTLKREKTMKDDDIKPGVRALEADRTRAASLMRLGRENNQDDLAAKFVAQGRSVEDFEDILATMANQSPPMREQPSRPMGGGARSGGYAWSGAAIGMSERDLGDYSLVRALRASIDPKYQREAGFELKVSDSLAQASGVRAKGLLVPLDALSVRAVTKGGTGGNLVPTEYLSSSFIDVLRARSFVMEHGTPLSGLQGDVVIPKKNASATAYWFAGDDSDAITDSTPTFGQVPLSPNILGAHTRMSHKMLLQSSPDIEQLVRLDLAAGLAVELDKQSIQGDGLSNRPLGVVNAPGVSALTYANGGAPSFADVVAMEGALAADNADMGSLAYLSPPAIAMGLKTTEKATGTAQFVWTSGAQNGVGSVNGYTAAYTTNCPAGTMIFGNWSDLLIGLWGMIEVDADPYGDNFAKGSLTVRAMLAADVALRRAESFVVLTEAPA